MSYEVLARKYRPSSFEEVVGQEHVIQALANSILQDRIHQAFMALKISYSTKSKV